MAVYLTPDMTLAEKLAAINAAMQQAGEQRKAAGIDAPVDPAEKLTCEACQ